MATSDKLTYLNETKRLIKNAIASRKLVNIDDTTKFRDYPNLIESLIEEIEDFLPKRTATGTNSLSYDKAQPYRLFGSEYDGNSYQEGTPTPDNPQEITTLRGYNTESVTIEGHTYNAYDCLGIYRHQKNLFDKEHLSKYGFSGVVENEGAIIWNDYYGMDYTHCIKVSGFKANTQYSVRYEAKKESTSPATIAFVSVQYTDGTTSDHRLNGLTTSYQTKEFTTTAGKSIDYILFSNGANSSNWSVKVNIDTLMIVEGTTLGTYEPYKEKTTYIDLQGNEVCKIGNVVDKLRYSNGHIYLDKYIGKVVLDGSETWYLTVENPYFNFYIWNKDITNMKLDWNYKLSNNFKYDARDFHSASVNTICENGGSNPLTIFKTDGTQGTTVAQWTSWLSTHNTEVYYKLAVPTTIDLGTYNIETLDNLNNVELLATLEPIGMSETYLFNINAEEVNE